MADVFVRLVDGRARRTLRDQIGLQKGSRVSRARLSISWYRKFYSNVNKSENFVIPTLRGLDGYLELICHTGQFSGEGLDEVVGG